MSVMKLSLKHGQTLDEARAHMEAAVGDVSRKFGAMVRKTDWSEDRSRVRLEGPGFWVEMWVDPVDVHASGDIPILGGLLGSPLASGLKQIVQQAFKKGLPPS